VGEDGHQFERALVTGLGTLVLCTGIALADEADDSIMKRRQQGILTGMPFMANIASRTFVDALGRSVFLAKAPKRVVSMAPSVTEILYALGLEDAIVAVTPYCDYPPEARHKIQLGGTHPSAEHIVSLKPDLVLVPQDFISPDLLQSLDHVKVPVYILKGGQLEDVLTQIQTVARMFQRVKAGDELVAAMRARWNAVREQTQSLSRPRVLYVLNSTPLQTVGPGTFIHQLIEAAGGTNIGAALSSTYPRLSLEEALAMDPEILVFPVGTAEGIPPDEQQQWHRWTTVSAVKTGRFVSVPSVLVDRPGPRLVEGVEWLARAIHPEAYRTVSP
jgi:ABC-type Fe3+-hydroxamate transport system substrate-binding protein